MRLKHFYIMSKLLKSLFIGFSIFGLFHCSFAHPVDLQTAQSIAVKFMGASDAQLVSTYQTDKSTAAFYVFNTENGFVIVSADDCETPIIGYSHEGRFDPNDVPVQMEDYLQDFVARIQYGIENHITADEMTAREWKLVKSTGRLNENKSIKTVEPLLTEKWHQGCLYNSLCPTMTGPCDHAEVGCVAVAMGQIMHYWGYPATGWGAHSYTLSGTTLSADFGNTIYDWENMPDSLTESSSEAEIEAVATLLFHCGVAVEMNYASNGSSSSTISVPNALKQYFQFSRFLHRDKKGSDNEAWMSKLKACLDQQCPILYSGKGNGSHAFVCDGYDDNDLLHFNWGWGGNADGYFALGNFNPIGYNFNSNNSAILDIFPHSEPCHVTALVYPSSAGTIEGLGEYHYGDYCTLTAMPVDNAKFLHWKKDGTIVSDDLSYSFTVFDDVENIEACFTFHDIGQITATEIPNGNTCVTLSWEYADTQWQLLKEFDIVEHEEVVTDGEYIYTNTSDAEPQAPARYAKYSMDGELLELFDIDGTYPNQMAFDGTYFYCSNGHDVNSIIYLFRLDLDQKTIVDSIYIGKPLSDCAYDPEYDGVWLFDTYNSRGCTLVDKQGEYIMGGPRFQSSFIDGFGHITARDGNGHLLIVTYDGIKDWNIANNTLSNIPYLDIPENHELNYVGGVSIGKYAGKDAMYFVCNNLYHELHKVFIYEIKSQLEQIIGYRIHRADSEGQAIVLAETLVGSSYTDYTWNEVGAGWYRFGISAVFANGTESEIIWSDPIMKSGHGINENNEGPNMQPVQKVFENGQIVIIKDGKRYTVTGQHLN